MARSKDPALERPPVRQADNCFRSLVCHAWQQTSRQAGSLLITESMGFLHNCVFKQELGNKNDGFAEICECSLKEQLLTQ
ncbi:MAG: hypothetical protein FJ264_10965 [Planctomycetes bacterium]|nr:hypothetical protein [Planctomycetota bacterium]